MQNNRRNTTFLRRLLIVYIAAIGLILVLLYDALNTPLLNVALVRFGFNTFVSFMFLALGVLVWLYARDRVTARLMYGVTCAVMFSFALETATDAGSLFAQTVSGACSSLALLLLALLLLHFPQDMFATLSQNRATNRNIIRLRLLQVYIFIAGSLCIVAMTYIGIYTIAIPPAWLEVCYQLYNIVIMAGIVGTMAISYRSTSSVRERQQRRLFVWGVVLSLSPLLLLTVIPEALQGIIPVTAVDGQLSTVSIVLLPIAFGYSILRYQLMVLDSYVRRVVMSVSGVVCLAVLVYVAQSTLNALMSAHSSPVIILLTLSLLAGLAPCLWYMAKAGTERLFFDEVRHYRRFISTPTTAGEQSLSFDEVAHLLIAAARQTFEAPDVCLFILDEKGETYHVSPAAAGGVLESGEQRFNHTIISLLSPTTAEAGLLDRERNPLIFERIAAAQRPLLLKELLAEEQPEPGLMRYLNIRQQEQEEMDTLFAPIRAQGVMIGILVLGPRGDQQLYAGPDFEIVETLIGRFAPFLETARVTLSLKMTNIQLGEANTHLRDANEQLQALDHLKDEFITIASHELRTPLTAVQGYISLLRDYNGEEELLPVAMRAEFLAKADLGCEELTLLLGNMTTAGDIEMVAQRVTLADVSLHNVTMNVAEMFDSLVQQQHRTIEITVPDEFSVRADAQALAQVLRNLIVNAIKYSPEGTPIQVSAVRQGEQIALAVRDFGKGIPPADQTRLFQRFVRLERDMNSPTRGSGLGLYISKQLITAMHGRIWVESSGEEGQGSTFALSLPTVVVYPEESTALSINKASPQLAAESVIR
ncbi:MAG TPA: HAMP domain-containing sensor histidine kinase [Ktedonobacteraceae bacterium]|nr:HAMP domain-containing sensor histidine kinase [Ktedonobacteraceae bacterium]